MSERFVCLTVPQRPFGPGRKILSPLPYMWRHGCLRNRLAGIQEMLETHPDMEPGSKITRLRRVSGRLDAISQAPQFLDHLCGACCSGLLAHSRAALLITDALMQNLPDQTAQTMGNGPDGLFEAEPRQ